MHKDSLAQHMKTCAGYFLKSSLLAHEPRCQSSAVCTGCNVRTHKDNLAQHMKTCAGYQNCKWCCHRFLKDSLLAHDMKLAQAAHEPRCQSSAVCTGCNVRMHKDSLAQHMNTCPGYQSCKWCYHRFLKSSLLAHELMSRGARVQQ
eukprot:TRINITY_DN4641_c0_g1_i5.p1 TRINITY_DN4641_c0_g1~~TRINITY_DN4641_c0_g1_i5.p1  ORF type:complete len:146 (-),score=43.70 TRINITY_DN4641_c0_g1_i5:16-453(-)